MRPFSFPLLLSALVLSFATGCLPKAKQNPKEDLGASFIITNFEVQNPTTSSLASWGIPQTQHYNFKVCVSDLARQDAIVHSSFEIETLLGQIQKVKTDELGCLVWSEKLDFDFLAQPTFVSFAKKIRPASENSHRGELKLKFALNPWSGSVGKEPAFVDLTKKAKVEPITDDVTALQTRMAQDQVSLLVLSPTIVLKEQTASDGQNFVYDLILTPAIRLKDMTGNEVLYSLTEGEFEITPFFVQQETSGSKKWLNAEVKSIKAKMKSTQLALTANTKLGTSAQNGKLLIGLRLTPVGGPAALASFEGLYEGPEMSRLKGSHSPKLSPVALTKGFSLADHLPVTKTLQNSVGVFGQKGPFIVETISGRIYGYTQNETNIKRGLPLELAFCAKSADAFSPLADENFTVEVLEQAKGAEDLNEASLSIPAQQFPAKTAENGCLTFNALVTHYVYHQEHFVEFKIRIKRASGNQIVDRRVFINPWGAWSNLLRDETQQKEIPRSSPDSQTALALQPTLRLRSVGSSQVEVFYKIDDQLRLEVHRRYNFQLAPEVVRFDSPTEARGTNPPLRTGYYLMTMALVRNDFEDTKRAGEYINSWQRVVLNEAGAITAEVEFSMRELALQGSRNLLLIELLPVEEEALQFDENKKVITPLSQVRIAEKSGLADKVFMVPFVALDQGNNERVPSEFNSTAQRIPVKGRLSNWVKQEIQKQKVLPREETKSPAMVADAAHLQLLDSSDKKAMQAVEELNANEIQALTECSSRAPIAKCLTEKKIDWKELNKKMCRLFLEQIYEINSERAEENKVGINPIGFSAACFHEPFRYVKVDTKIHSYKLAKQTFSGGLTRTFDVSSNVGLSEGRSESTSRSFSYSMGFSALELIGDVAGAAGPIINIFYQLAKPYGYSVSNTSSQSHDRNIAISGGTSAQLLIQEAQFDLNLSESQKCLAIFPSSEVKGLGLTSIIEDRLKGYYICQPKSKNSIATKEKYYFVSQNFTQGALLNNNDIRNRPWMLFIRGERDFNMFFSMIQNNLRSRDNSGRPEDPVTLFGEAFDQIRQTLPAYTGVHSPTIVTSAPSTTDEKEFLQNTSDFLPKP